MAQLPVTVTNNETFPRTASYFSCYPEARRTLSIRIGPKSDRGRGDKEIVRFERGIPVVVQCTRNSGRTIGLPATRNMNWNGSACWPWMWCPVVSRISGSYQQTATMPHDFGWA